MMRHIGLPTAAEIRREEAERAERQPKRRVAILDPEAFAALVRAAVERCGSVTGAKEKLGISRGHLYRLKNPTRGQHVALETVDRLARLAGPLPWNRFTGVVLTPTGRERRGRYRAWLSEGLGRFAWAPVSALPEFRARRTRKEEATLASAGRELRVTGLIAELRGRPAVWGAVERFRRAAERLGWTERDARYMLALRRALEPLVAHEQSGGVELSAQEMSDEMLLRYLDRGLEAELILLDRPPDTNRIVGRPRKPTSRRRTKRR